MNKISTLGSILLINFALATQRTEDWFDKIVDKQTIEVNKRYNNITTPLRLLEVCGGNASLPDPMMPGDCDFGNLTDATSNQVKYFRFVYTPVNATRPTVLFQYNVTNDTAYNYAYFNKSWL